MAQVCCTFAKVPSRVMRSSSSPAHGSISPPVSDNRSSTNGINCTLETGHSAHFYKLPRHLVRTNRLQKSQKQLAARNKEQLNRALLITLGIHCFFLLSKFLFSKTWSGRSITVYILCSLPSWVIQFWFERIARPTYDKETGQLRRAGEDLEAQGLTEWMWDVLYWTQGCLVMVAAVGDGAWWIWVSQPTENRSAAQKMLMPLSSSCHCIPSISPTQPSLVQNRVWLVCQVLEWTRVSRLAARDSRSSRSGAARRCSTGNSHWRSVMHARARHFYKCNLRI
ncbi:Meiotically up-regulated gene 69 protein [Diplodia seriata]|uniref:Meiotically up-regulated gene 69 protein n=1 Tax=Diplodia seriata TaxID=420778 RepID=A0A1S8B8Q4_9PEZI|nr:Meiotically up-regulated gene 69 protein [Diplodia seriata]